MTPKSVLNSQNLNFAGSLIISGVVLKRCKSTTFFKSSCDGRVDLVWRAKDKVSSWGSVCVDKRVILRLEMST